MGQEVKKIGYNRGWFFFGYAFFQWECMCIEQYGEVDLAIMGIFDSSNYRIICAMLKSFEKSLNV